LRAEDLKLMAEEGQSDLISLQKPSPLGQGLGRSGKIYSDHFKAFK